MKFSHILEQSPRDWETTLCQNVALTVFHIQIYVTMRGKLSDILLFSNPGKNGLKSKENYGTNLSDRFSPLHDLLPTISHQ